MTEREVRTLRDKIGTDPILTDEEIEYIWMAMDKQEPMKPIPMLSITPNKSGEGWKKIEEYTCSICERVVEESDKYCWHCGQKLDWE